MRVSLSRAKRIVPRLMLEGKKRLYHFRYFVRRKKHKNNRIEFTSEYLRRNMTRVFFSPYPDLSFDRIKANRQLFEDIIKAADNVLQDRFYILHRHYDNIRKSDGHYKWHTDIFSGYTYPVRYKEYYTHAAFETEKQDHQDIKGPWELSRLQFIVAPAIAWNLTKKDEYADKVVEILLDWININTLDEGPNWRCAMEAGIRIVNMLLAFQLIIGYKRITDAIADAFMQSVKDHLYFISNNLENYAGKTYNHYLGDILGILAIVSSCPFLSRANKVYQIYKNEFEKQIQKQILADGGDFEGSTCYHCLVGEMFALAALIVENNRDRFSTSYYEKLSKMMEFSLSLRKKEKGLQPQIGDNDSGRIIEIIPHNALNYDWFINIAHFIVRKTFITPYYADLLSFMLGEGSVAEVETNSAINHTSFGLAGFKDETIYILLAGTEAQKYGLGGHTHNDKLAVEINYKGVDFIIDPGSGVYTSDENKHRLFRSIKSHSTVIVDDYEQNKAQIIGFFGNSYDCNTTIEMTSCSRSLHTIKGICKVKNNELFYVHTRSIDVAENQILISDRIDGERIKSVSVNFIIAPNIEVELRGKEAILRCGTVEMILHSEQQWMKDNASFSPQYGDIVDCFRLYTVFPYSNMNIDTLITISETTR